MCLYVYVSVYGPPKLQGIALHMQTPVKTLLIALYVIAITQVNLPELTAMCSAHICRIKLSSGPR